MVIAQDEQEIPGKPNEYETAGQPNKEHPGDVITPTSPKVTLNHGEKNPIQQVPDAEDEPDQGVAKQVRDERARAPAHEPDRAVENEPID